MSPDDYRLVLDAFAGCGQPLAVERLGSAGGFSGSRFWKLQTAAGPLCLRQWPPEHPSEPQLRFIHAVLVHAAGRGFPWAPVPCQTVDRQRYVRHAGRLWQLEPWMPGVADYRRRPSPERLCQAMAALARFHLATVDFSPRQPAVATSPAIGDRRARIDRWLSGELEQLASALGPETWPELRFRARRILESFPRLAGPVRSRLDRAGRLAVALQPCIRDVWHAHVLFEGDRVSGLVDFGALDWETVAADVSRLLGSMAGNETDGWRTGLEAYQAIRPLSLSELELVWVLDASGVLLSGLNWLDWIYRERRQFEHRPGVMDRLDSILARLEAMTSGWRIP
jgi:homoserine kinase type II